MVGWVVYCAYKYAEATFKEEIKNGQFCSTTVSPVHSEIVFDKSFTKCFLKILQNGFIAKN